MTLFSDSVCEELRDRVRDVFSAVDQQTKLAVEHSMRQQLGIGDDARDVDCWAVFARRIYKTVRRLEEQWAISKMRRGNNDTRRTEC
jgi:hypothetical protein